MKKKLRQKLLTAYAQSQEYDKQQANRQDCWRNLHPDSAELLAVLVHSRQARKVLEVGTSNGLSTLWLADAVRDTGGKVRTLEIDNERRKVAKRHFKKYELDSYIRSELCDAGDFLREYKKYYDLIFLDADRSQYCHYWPDLKRLLVKAGSVLVVDNVKSHESEVADFVNLVRECKDFQSTVVSIGAGLLIAVRI